MIELLTSTSNTIIQYFRGKGKKTTTEETEVVQKKPRGRKAAKNGNFPTQIFIDVIFVIFNYLTTYPFFQDLLKNPFLHQIFSYKFCVKE